MKKEQAREARVKRTVELEQYYTCQDLALRCIRAVEAKFTLKSFSLVLEPSAGDGSFFLQLPESNRIGIDMDPRAEGIKQADFFLWEPPFFERNILTIGNPPFGRRGCLAMDFLNKSCQFSRVVAFILPRSFKKDTFINRINPSFHLVEEFDCDSFRSPEGDILCVKSVFQIWERRSELRNQIERSTSHEDFDLKHAHLSRITPAQHLELKRDYHFAIAQVGSNFKPKPLGEINAGSYWFVRMKRDGIFPIFERLDFSFLEGKNLSFTSLSKKDIIQAYCEAI